MMDPGSFIGLVFPVVSPPLEPLAQVGWQGTGGGGGRGASTADLSPRQGRHDIH